MDAAHVHLLVNHVSLFAVVFGLMALVWSFFRDSSEMRMAAVLLFIFAAVFSWIAMESGEGAEELVEHLPGVSESYIEYHEEAAETAYVSMILLGLMAVGLGVVARFKKSWLKTSQVCLFLAGLVALGLVARAAQLGGLIRHSELRDGGANVISDDSHSEE